MELTSPELLDDWHGDMAVFNGQLQTVPDVSIRSVGWNELCERLAPVHGPRISEEKGRLEYFLPSLLREDLPYVGKTARKMQERGRTHGAMRSSRHVIAATWLVLEFDGLTREQLEKGIGALHRARLAHLAYTTWSHGDATKPGIRVRVIIPVDCAMNRERYRAAHTATNAILFGNLADRTGANLSQLQSVWGCHPARQRQASRRMRRGGVLHLERLLEIHCVRPTGVAAVAVRMRGPASADHDLPGFERIKMAMNYLIADSYGSWISGVMAFKALAAQLGEAPARELALQFSATSPNDSMRALLADTDERYNTRSVFDKTVPNMTPQAAAGFLLARARDRAVSIVNSQRGRPSATDESRLAAQYLAAFHPRRWSELTGGK